MKKLLITLRHPGPTQAVFSVLPSLVEKYDIYIAASNSGLEFIITRYSQYLHLIKLYFTQDKKWIKYSDENLLFVNADNLEYRLDDEESIKWLTIHLAELINKCSIDIVLRTTPAINWGLDEVAADACEIALSRSKCICYQEDYACGNNLESMINPIAVVDECAGQLIEEKGLNYFKVGWLSQSLYSQGISYQEQRTLTRNQLQLTDVDTALLYVVGATGKFKEEVKIFQSFLRIKGYKLFYKFHPRNTGIERKKIQEEARGKAIEFTGELGYEAALSFPDFIISVASAMNQDAIQYQIETGENKLSTVSMYTRGDVTNTIIFSVLGRTDLPQTESNRGSVLIAEMDMEKTNFELEEKKRIELFEEASKRFGVSASERVANILTYIEGVR